MSLKSRSNVTSSRRSGSQTSMHFNNDKSKLSVSKDRSSRNPRHMGRETNSGSAKSFSKNSAEPVGTHDPHIQSFCSSPPSKGRNKASNSKSSAQRTADDGKLSQGEMTHDAPALVCSLQGINLSNPKLFDCSAIYEPDAPLPKPSSKPPPNYIAKAPTKFGTKKAKEVAIDIPLIEKRHCTPHIPPASQPDELNQLIHDSIIGDPEFTKLFPNVSWD